LAKEEDVNLIEVKEFKQPSLRAGSSAWNEAKIRVLGRQLQEARVSSEVPELFRTAFNTKLLDGYTEHMAIWNQIFDLVTLNKGKAVDFPGLKGIHVYKAGTQTSPSGETGREVRHTGPASGEAKMEVDKYECICGFDEDMLDDIEVDMMGWCLRMVGNRFKQKEDYVAFAAMTARGANMTANAGTTLSAAALESGLAALLNRTVTTGGRAELDPITPDYLVVDPTHSFQAKELINTTLTVAANIAAANAPGGSNVFQNLLNVIVTPYIDTTYYYIGLAGTFGGSIFLRRLVLQIKSWEDLLRDTENFRAKARFAADIVEPDKLCRTAY